MGMARVAEQKVNITKGWCSKFAQHRSPQPLITNGSRPPNRNPLPIGSNGLSIKRLTPSEMAARREKELCFNCDDKYVPGHKCTPRFQCFLLEDTGEMEELIDLKPTVEPMSEDTRMLPGPPPADIMSTISFHALQGRLAPSTLRLEGLLNGETVVILVDSGSTHNFIQTRVAKHAKLAIEPSPHLKVTIGNGDELRCEGFTREVKPNIGNAMFSIDFHLLPIYGADIVLGAQWLADIGPALFDYKHLWVSFEHKGETIKLFGLQPQGQLAELTLGQLRKANRADSIASFYQLAATSEPNNVGDVHVSLPIIPDSLNPEQQAGLQQLITKHQSVFLKPSGLPPKRNVDHKIPLKSECTTVRVRPFCYPKYQKQEIDRLVCEMLDAGMIRSSSSPFASPVLLVKKKDGSWRFCVDYRALNAATIPDRYPIPTADELFDELHGTCIYSKLDLRSEYHQIRMAEEDIHKTTFRTRRAL